MFNEKELDSNLKLTLSDSSKPNKKVAKISIFYIFLHFILFYYFCVFTLSLRFMVNASTNVNILHLEANKEEIYMNDKLFKLFLYMKQPQNINFLYKWNLVIKDLDKLYNIKFLNDKIYKLCISIHKLKFFFKSISSNPELINYLLVQIQRVFTYYSNNNMNLQFLSQTVINKYAIPISNEPRLKDFLQNVYYEKIQYASELENNFILNSNIEDPCENIFQYIFKLNFFKILKEFEETILSCVKAKHSKNFKMQFYDLFKSLFLPIEFKFHDFHDFLKFEVFRENRIKNHIEFIKKNFQNNVIKVGEQRSFIVAAFVKMFKLVLINDLKEYFESNRNDKINICVVLSHFPPFFAKLNEFIHEINTNIVTKVNKKENFHYNNSLVLFIIYNLLEGNDFHNKKLINDSDDLHNLSERINNHFFDSIIPYKAHYFYENTRLFFFFANLIELNFYLLSKTMNIESVFDIFCDIHDMIKQEIENCDK